MRATMPGVAEAVDKHRATWGADWVNAQIKAGLAGEPGHFYAFEGGHVLGTPFTADPGLMQAAAMGAALGSRFFVAIRPPEGAAPC